jgi:hypothetical protein
MKIEKKPSLHRQIQARVAAAFKKLRDAGYVAEPNYACCSNCAVAGLTDLAANIRASGRNAHGLAYYHAQDHESLMLSKGEAGVWIGFSTCQGESHQQAVRIGQAVVNALRASRLDVVWNGKASTRIHVKGITTEVKIDTTTMN